MVWPARAVMLRAKATEPEELRVRVTSMGWLGMRHRYPDPSRFIDEQVHLLNRPAIGGDRTGKVRVGEPAFEHSKNRIVRRCQQTLPLGG